MPRIIAILLLLASLTATAANTHTGDHKYTGDIDIGGDLTVTGNVTVAGEYTGDLNVTGTITVTKQLWASAQTLTIAAGEMTPTVPLVQVQGEGDTADTLVSINGWTGTLIVTPYTTTAAITVSHGLAPGQIALPGADPLTIPDYGALTLYRASTADCWSMTGLAGTISSEDEVTATSAYGTDNVLIRANGTGRDTQATGITVDDGDTLILPDSGTNPPLNVTERSAEPSSPSAGDIYLDDGTNTASTSPGWRRYTGSAWEDISAASGGGGGGSDATLSDAYIIDVSLTSNGQDLGTATGLAMTTLTVYRVSGSINLAGASAVSLRINNDSSSGNYDGSSIAQSGTTLGDSDNTSSLVGAYLSTDSAYTIDGTVMIDAEGYATFDYKWNAIGTSVRLLHYGQIRYTSTTVANITGFVLHSASATGLGAGSWLKVWEDRDVSVSGGGSSSMLTSGSYTVDQYQQYLKRAYLFDSDTPTDSISGAALVEHGGPTYSTGKFGNAVDLASGAYLEGVTPGQQPSNMLISMWINRDGIGANDYIWGFRDRDGANYGWNVNANTSNVIYARVQDNSGNRDVTTTTTLSASTWFHVVGYIDVNDKHYIYINGTSEGSGGTIDTTIVPLSNFTLGTFYDSNAKDLGQTFDGLIDQVLIYVDIPYHSLGTDIPALVTELYNSGDGLNFQ